MFNRSKRISEENTICAECKHCINAADFNAGVWYNWFCGASLSKQIMNFVTGEMEYIHGKMHPNCSEVNDGKCTLFEFERRKDLEVRIGKTGRLLL